MVAAWRTISQDEFDLVISFPPSRRNYTRHTTWYIRCPRPAVDFVYLNDQRHQALLLVLSPQIHPLVHVKAAIPLSPRPQFELKQVIHDVTNSWLRCVINSLGSLRYPDMLGPQRWLLVQMP